MATAKFLKELRRGSTEVCTVTLCPKLVSTVVHCCSRLSFIALPSIGRATACVVSVTMARCICLRLIYQLSPLCRSTLWHQLVLQHRQQQQQHRQRQRQPRRMLVSVQSSLLGAAPWLRWASLCMLPRRHLPYLTLCVYRFQYVKSKTLSVAGGAAAESPQQPQPGVVPTVSASGRLLLSLSSE